MPSAGIAAASPSPIVAIGASASRLDALVQVHNEELRSAQQRAGPSLTRDQTQFEQTPPPAVVRYATGAIAQCKAWAQALRGPAAACAT